MTKEAVAEVVSSSSSVQDKLRSMGFWSKFILLLVGGWVGGEVEIKATSASNLKLKLSLAKSGKGGISTEN